MKLKRLKIVRLPGIDQPFEVTAEGGGVHVVFGPNGIGKSSLCRAVEALYWEERGPSQRISVTAEFDLAEEDWWAEREGPRIRWQRGGQNSAPPSLPSPHSHACFFLHLRDLIDPSPEGTRDIAAEIRRQMSGGFDLAQIIAQEFSGIGARHGRRERQTFNTDAKAVDEAAGRQQQLQRDADRLEELNTRLREAEASTKRLSYVQRAIGLAGRLEERSSVEAEMAALPASLAKLSGKEIEQIDELQKQLDELDDQARTLQHEHDEAQERRNRAGLAGLLDPAMLEAWSNKADRLYELDQALGEARAQHSARQQELAARLRDLGDGDLNAVRLGVADRHRLFDFLRQAWTNNMQVETVQERIELLGRIPQADVTEGGLDKRRQSVDALRAWLRTPEPTTFVSTIRRRWVWLALVLIVAGAGVGLAVAIDPAFALVVAAAAGAFMVLLLLHGTDGATVARRLSREAFDQSGSKEPAEWDIATVQTLLRELEHELAELEAGRLRARDRSVEREGLKNRLTQLLDKATEFEANRQRLAESLKLKEVPPDAELVDYARALDAFRDSRGKDEEAAGRVSELERNHEALLSQIGEFLEGHGEPRPADSADARARLRSLNQRSEHLQNAVRDEERAVRDLQQKASDRRKKQGEMRRIYSTVSLEEGDLPSLTALLERLQTYRDVKRQLDALANQIELDRVELAKAGEEPLAGMSLASLELLQSELQLTSADATELRNEIARINASVHATRQDNSLLALIARRENARAALGDRLDEALFADAGRFLIRTVEEEYEQTQMPRVFERAREHFSAFTHHRYELRLGGDGETPHLFALDLASSVGRALDELSDATRAQLLLAARIAFAEEVEHGLTLPLFLDEALDQSDPTRFEAIVRGLGRLGEDQGRQVFYLTSDPLDAKRISYALELEDCSVATEIDLGLIRTRAASVSGPDALHFTPTPAVPGPNGMTAEQYGAELRVQSLVPMGGHAQQHVFYVLFDDLDLLHRFLSNGIERVGQWKSVSNSPLAERLGGLVLTRSLISARIDLLEVFCELWKQGRGRPVDREVLENSEALSKRYLDDVVAISRELGDQADKLLDALEAGGDPRLRGFRKSSIETLERYLREDAYLDERPVLARAELRLRALASPAANSLPEDAAAVCLDRWLSWTAGTWEIEAAN